MVVKLVRVVFSWEYRIGILVLVGSVVDEPHIDPQGILSHRVVKVDFLAVSLVHKFVDRESQVVNHVLVILNLFKGRKWYLTLGKP